MTLKNTIVLIIGTKTGLILIYRKSQFLKPIRKPIESIFGPSIKKWIS